MYNQTTPEDGAVDFLLPQESVFRLLYLVLVSAAAVFGNLLVLVALVRFPSLRRAANLMLASLAMADLLVGSVTGECCVY